MDPKDIPVVAIIDAELMQSMPAKTIASTGMDALTHAIEGYITKGAHALQYCLGHAIICNSHLFSFLI